MGIIYPALAGRKPDLPSARCKLGRIAYNIHQDLFDADHISLDIRV